MSVSRETRLAIYCELLLRWSGSINLSSERDSERSGFDRHIADSLALLPYLPADLDRLIDFGSGQGFPAIPVAISTGIRVELIESDRRKAAFLTTTLATLGLDGAAWPHRIEAVTLPKARCVTARALAPISKLLMLARRHLAEGGICLFLKGPNAAVEVQEAQATMRFDAEIFPTASPRSNLVRIANLR